MAIQPEDLEICLRVLQEVSDDPDLMSRHERFKGLVARIHKEGKKSERRANQRQDRQDADALKQTTQIVRQQIVGPAACEAVTDLDQQSEKQLRRAILCYICKQPYTRLHFFYHLLCPDCADFSYAKRCQRTNLTGRVALVTGGRIKIGYQTALRMLRDGAEVIVTTRFPNDCASRFHSEPDFPEWRHRLHVYGLDLRNVLATEEFAHHLLESLPALDIIVNNAAQTIKRPIDFYEHLFEGERSLTELPGEARQIVHQTGVAHRLLEASEVQRQEWNTLAALPSAPFDFDGQPLDKRPINSWLLKLHEVGTRELLEVQVVNAIAPFLLNARLKPLLMRSSHMPRFVVNVSAMEGQFQRESKTTAHPHTNMAKAALNMMTRTSAADYAADSIWMNSVDTGWITDENPFPKKTRMQEKHGFYPPLDVIDGMARIYDPIVQGIARPNEPVYGHFLKDFVPHPW